MLRPVLSPVMRHVLSPALAILLGVGSFSPMVLFAQNEPGFHAETYNPDSLLVRRNRLTYSQQVTNAIWNKAGNITATDNAAAAPDGTATAGLIVGNTTNATHQILQAGTRASGPATFVLSVYLKQAGARYALIEFQDTVGWCNTGFDLQTGAILNGAAGPSMGTGWSLDANGIEDAGNGWWRVFIRCTTVNASTVLNSVIRTSLAANPNAGSPGDGVSGTYVWGAQTETGTARSDYQKVTDWNTEYTAAALERIGMWQDSSGTPVTAVEQPCGLWMDRKAPSHTQRWPGLSAVPPVVLNANGTIAVVGDVITATSTAAGTYGISIPIYGAAGSSYLVQYELLTNSNTRSTGCDFVGRFNSSLGSALGPKRVFHINASVPGAALLFYAYGAVGAGESFSVRVTGLTEIPGNHATQATANSRPVLSARYNLLTKTEQLADAAWLKTAGGTGVAPVVTDRFGAGPDGTMTASRVQFNRGAGVTTADFSYLGQTPGGLTVGADVRSDVWLKSNDGTPQDMVMVGAGGGGVFITVTGEWKLFSVTQATFSAGVDPTRLLLRGDRGAATADILYWHPDVRSAADAALAIPPYQRVNTATDYDTTGFIHYLKFDGLDDSLQTPSIDFTGVDKMTVWAGATKLSDAALAILTELGIGNQPGSVYIAAPHVAATPGYRFQSRGSVGADTDLPTGYAAPVSSILTGLGDIAGDLSALSVNGAQAGSFAGDQGTGNYGAYPLNIGRRNNASLPFNGRLTSLTVRGSTSPTAANFIAKMNRYAARLAGQTNVTA